MEPTQEQKAVMMSNKQRFKNLEQKIAKLEILIDALYQPEKEKQLAYNIGFDIGELQKRVSKLELLSEPKEQPGGSFKTWWANGGKELCKNRQEIAEIAFNAGKSSNK